MNKLPVQYAEYPNTVAKKNIGMNFMNCKCIALNIKAVTKIATCILLNIPLKIFIKKPLKNISSAIAGRSAINTMLVIKDNKDLLPINDS